MGEKVYTSNLINNPELTRRFSIEAVNAARSMRKKYYSLFCYMTEEDIMIECWDKILRQDIGFDESKMCKFTSFVYMMVNNRCIDMCRKIKKYEGSVSLDADYSTSNGDTVSLLEYIPDNKDFTEEQEIENSIRSACKYIKGYPTDEIIRLKFEGYNLGEISDILDVKYSDVSKVVNNVHSIIKNKENENLTIEDIIYGDECVFWENEKIICDRICLIKDDYGNRLSDILKMIVKGYSYSSMLEKLNPMTDVQRLQQFIMRCESIVVI